MTNQRSDRVAEALRQEISNIVQYELKDPRLGFITITKVELTRDLRFARIYFSVLGEQKDKKKTMKGLNSAKGYIKGLLSDKIKLRYMPDIVFKIDETLDDMINVQNILAKIHKEKKDEGSN